MSYLDWGGKERNYGNWLVCLKGSRPQLRFVQHKENGARYQGILQESEMVMDKVSLVPNGQAIRSCEPLRRADTPVGERPLRNDRRRAGASTRCEGGRIVQRVWYAIICVQLVHHKHVGIFLRYRCVWRRETSVRESNDQRRDAVQG